MDTGITRVTADGRQVDRVVVTGIGVASALGCSIEEFWAKLLAGESGVSLIQNFDLSHCRTRIGAQVAGYDPSGQFSAKELQRLSRTSQLALIASRDALEDAEFALSDSDPHRIGVIIGSSTGGFTASEPFFERYFHDGTTSPLAVPTLMNNAPASNISIRYGFRGPLLTTDAACASSAHAIGYAYNLVRFGLLDAALTGGADCSLSPGIVKSWSSLRALSERNDTPKQACRPFSLDRDGMVLGEGAGILLVESEKSAVQRKAKIYAAVTGYGASSDSNHLTQPSLEGPSAAMKLALADARLLPQDIDYVSAHGTATRWNDKIETAAIKNVFGARAFGIPVVSIKAAIGHSMAASAALEFISCILSIRDGVVPATINYSIPDPECDLDYVVEGKRAWETTHAMSNSFAFGGSNAVLIGSRYAASG